MYLMSWNINGLRSILKQGFHDFLQSYQPDILCLQEIRATPHQVNLSLDDYQIYWNPAEKKGYSGTALLCRLGSLPVTTGMKTKKHKNEGRVMTADLGDYFLVNVYTPNAQRDLARLEYRTQGWDVDFRQYLQDLERQKPVIFCGDLNVAHQELDLANPKTNKGNAGFTDEERESFDLLLKSGYVDAFREFVSEGGHYTWWSYRGQARQNNVGWRIDYFGVSQTLRDQIIDSGILPEVKGSDHCPIYLKLG